VFVHTPTGEWGCKKSLQPTNSDVAEQMSSPPPHFPFFSSHGLGGLKLLQKLKLDPSPQTCFSPFNSWGSFEGKQLCGGGYLDRLQTVSS